MPHYICCGHLTAGGLCDILEVDSRFHVQNISSGVCKFPARCQETDIIVGRRIAVGIVIH